MAIGLCLTPEQTELQQTARDFAISEIQALAQKLDESFDPNLVPWDLCKGVFYKGASLGFTSLLLPQELGGGGRKCIDFALVQEELGAVDASIASSYFSLSNVMPLLIGRAGSSEQVGS